MIRPSNIDNNLHKADFICDTCQSHATNVNLNTKLLYTKDQNFILVDHSILSNPLCNGQYCTTSFPKNGNPLAQKIWAAKSE